jgi:hypothetical protein
MKDIILFGVRTVSGSWAEAEAQISSRKKILMHVLIGISLCIKPVELVISLHKLIQFVGVFTLAECLTPLYSFANIDFRTFKNSFRGIIRAPKTFKMPGVLPGSLSTGRFPV